jgi:DNA-binding PadR family transcriptional regulator
VAHEEKRPPRKYFKITDSGKTELMQGLERYKALAPVDIDGVIQPGRNSRSG